MRRLTVLTIAALLLLHELIHVRSGEQTHLGPWWSAQDEFRRYYDAE